MTMRLSKLKSAALGALAVTALTGVTTVASVTEAEAQWRRHRGAAVAAGIIGGIAAGAIIASAARPAYAAPVYGYGHGFVPTSYGATYAPAYSYAPTYSYAPFHGYGYHPVCYTRKVRQVIDYDTVVIRRVRVCE